MSFHLLLTEFAQKILPFLKPSLSTGSIPQGIQNSKATFILLISIQLASFLVFLFAQYIAKLRRNEINNGIGEEITRYNETTALDGSTTPLQLSPPFQNSTQCSVNQVRPPTEVKLTLKQYYEKRAEHVETVFFYYLIMSCILSNFIFLFSKYNIDVKLPAYFTLATISLIIIYGIYLLFNMEKVKRVLTLDDKTWIKRFFKTLYYLVFYSIFSFILAVTVKKYKLINFSFSK
jgi:hypothetical protein